MEVPLLFVRWICVDAFCELGEKGVNRDLLPLRFFFLSRFTVEVKALRNSEREDVFGTSVGWERDEAREAEGGMREETAAAPKRRC